MIWLKDIMYDYYRKRILEMIIDAIIYNHNMIEHLKFAGRFYIDDKLQHVSRHPIDLLLQDDVTALCIDKTVDGYYEFFKLLLSVYNLESQLDENGKLIISEQSLQYVFSPYIEISQGENKNG